MTTNKKDVLPGPDRCPESSVFEAEHLSPEEIKRNPEIVAKIMASFSSGPIPSAEQLKEYDKVVPGSAQTIIAAWTGQTAHRQELEKKQLAADVEFLRSAAGDSRLGLWLGTVMGLAALTAGVLFAVLGHPVGGATIITTTLVGLVGSFIYGSRNMNNFVPREEQAESEETEES
ncbi:DUF2335 domain-containing protein [Pseudodesulfovibrio sp.]|uniref:DUF2335 domain-containing protein n=1 Tax=unclassified Pseudodesulfovibrio TaxID=2661612 RepID=UPI003AFFD280